MDRKAPNRINWIIAATIIAISIIATGIAFSLSPELNFSDGIHEQSLSPHNSPMMTPIPFGVKLLLNAQELNVLSQLTGKPIDIIREQIRCKPLSMFLEENGITPELFRTVMDERVLILVNQASAANIITKGQSEQIIEMINKHTARLDRLKVQIIE